jgi:hypothetical protein
MKHVTDFLKGFFYSFIAIAALPFLLIKSIIEL